MAWSPRFWSQRKDSLSARLRHTGPNLVPKRPSVRHEVASDRDGPRFYADTTGDHLFGSLGGVSIFM